MLKLILVATGFLLFSIAGKADVYVWRDAQGVLNYSDRLPPEGARDVKILRVPSGATNRAGTRQPGPATAGGAGSGKSAPSGVSTAVGGAPADGAAGAIGGGGSVSDGTTTAGGGTPAAGGGGTATSGGTPAASGGRAATSGGTPAASGGGTLTSRLSEWFRGLRGTTAAGGGTSTSGGTTTAGGGTSTSGGTTTASGSATVPPPAVVAPVATVPPPAVVAPVATVPPVVKFISGNWTQKSLCTFANSPTDCGLQLQARAPDRASLVNIGRDGSTSLRLHTEPGDNNLLGSGTMERADMYLSQADTGCYEGREQVWEHSILFPDDFSMPTWQGYVVFDFHHTGPTGQANFHVFFKAQPDIALPGILTLRGFGGQNVNDGMYEAPIGLAKRNVWYDFVYHVKWSSGSDGFFDAWVNGEQKLQHRGPTMYAGQGCYLKLANYHTPVCDPYPACIGTHPPSSVIHDRVIRHDLQ